VASDGQFRFSIDGVFSDWTSYRGIARLDLNDKHYFAVSAYHDGIFPIETILEFK